MARGDAELAGALARSMAAAPERPGSWAGGAQPRSASVGVQKVLDLAEQLRSEGMGEQEALDEAARRCAAEEDGRTLPARAASTSQGGRL